jgi:hypothetical protein
LSEGAGVEREDEEKAGVGVNDGVEDGIDTGIGVNVGVKKHFCYRIEG